MSELPTIFVVTVEGDHSDDDYTGVTKRVTPTGAEYRIVGPLADALRRHDDNLDSAFQRAYGEKETMLLNQAKTIKEMQAEIEGRDALAWMQMHMPYRYYEAIRAMIQVGEK